MTRATPSDAMPDRHRLTRRALIVFLPLLLLLTVINVALLVSGAHQKHVQIEQTVLNSLRMLKDASVIVEETFAIELEEGLQLFLDEYITNDNGIEQIDLAGLQRRLNNHVDLYAIDASGVVQHSTLAQDVGLDFRQWPDFHRYLEEIRQSGELRIDAISKETNTGLFRKYAYLPTPDKHWILELGIKSEIIAQRLAPFDPIVVAQRLVTDHPYLNQLRIIDRHGWQLSMTQPTQVEPEVFERVKQVFDTSQAQNILGWNRTLRYLPLPDSVDEASFGLRMQVVEFDYNLNRVMLGVGINLIFALAAIVLALRLSRRMNQIEGKLRESESKLSTLFASMTEMVVLHDLIFDGEGNPLNYRITDCNAAFTKITGIPRNNAVGRLATEVYGSESPPYLNEFSAVATNGEPYQYETYFQPMDKHFSISVVSPEKNRFATVTTDISERKRTEEAIKAARKQLEIKNEELEQFVYSVSHDLKSPLITVKTFAGLLRQDFLDGEQQKINEDLSYIEKATDTMQQLLDALQQYSRIGSVVTPIQTQSANQLINGCLTALAGILHHHQVRVSTEELPQQLHGVPLHFQQIWQNLIENAVKYMGDQIHPHIDIGATQQDNDVVFYVRDNGMGIAPEHNDRIFNLFSQLNPKSDGSGLGLALVKKIISIYQGHIWVESAGSNQGSCFYFTLPDSLMNKVTESRQQYDKQ